MAATYKRQRHYISGLGDGHVHEKPRTNVLFPDAPNRLTPYIRTRRAEATVKTLPTPRAIFDAGFSGSGDEDATEGPWRISAVVLLCLMGLLVGLFLHLVSDSAEKQPYHSRRTRRLSPTKKKKTDEWIDDENGDEYRADTETTIYHPYHVQKTRHRTGSSSSATLHHRTHSSTTYDGPSSSRHANAATSHSPRQQNLRQTRSIDSEPISRGGSRTIAMTTEEDTAWTVQALAARPLSPVSSFASVDNQSTDMDTSHEGDEETGTPSPVIIAKVASFDVGHQSSRLLSPGTEDRHDLGVTPKACTRRRPVALEEESYTTNLLPPPPMLETTQQQHEQAGSTRRPVLLPYLPDLAVHQSSPMHDGHEVVPHAAASEPQHYDATVTEPPQGGAAYPGHIQQSPQKMQRHVSSPERVPASNDPRRNIIHKRADISLCTDTESSLMGSIDFSEIILDKVIGGGGFGQVWKATWRSTPVAVKILTGSAQREIVSKGILEEFAAEINMLKGMRHPNICLYMGACLKPPNRAIITELAANGSLWDALRLPLQPPFTVADGSTLTAWPLTLYPDRGGGVAINPIVPPQGSWPWVLVKRVACGAARGMTYLHSGTPPVLHRDLKSANILLDDSYTAKVCDFGLSRLKAQERSMTGNCGTVQWMAPEVLANQRYAEPADVYSFGTIVWEMLTGECPYEGMSAIQCALAVLNRDLRPEIPTWCPQALSALIRACWEKDPYRRPSFSQIIMALDAMP